MKTDIDYIKKITSKVPLEHIMEDWLAHEYTRSSGDIELFVWHLCKGREDEILSDIEATGDPTNMGCLFQDHCDVCFDDAPFEVFEYARNWEAKHEQSVR